MLDAVVLDSDSPFPPSHVDPDARQAGFVGELDLRLGRRQAGVDQQESYPTLLRRFGAAVNQRQDPSQPPNIPAAGLGAITIESLEIFRVHVNKRGNWIIPRLKTSNGLTGLGDASHGGHDEETTLRLFRRLRGPKDALRGGDSKALRDHLNLREGTQVMLTVHGDELRIRKANNWRELRGMLAESNVDAAAALIEERRER